MRRWAGHPLWLLMMTRLKEFFREPEAVFWTYGFPLVMVIGLGIAFREKPIERFRVDVQEGPSAATLATALSADKRFDVETHNRDMWARHLRTGKNDVVVVPAENGRLEYHFDPTRPESSLARAAVDDYLQRQSGRRDPVITEDRKHEEPGSRYIDWLVPGLLGISILAGSLWGIGFVIVDMRIKHLLKRLAATPMRRSHFLLGTILSRLVFMIPEVLAILLFSRWAFDVRVNGSWFVLIGLIILGALSFSGIALLVACRARTIEAATGLINLFMMPMWMLSGVFFAYERFPEWAHPFIRLLPLTALNDATRAVMIEGVSLWGVMGQCAVVATWGIVCFGFALRLFRW